MPADASVPAATLLGGLLVLARVAGAFVFVPLPGMKNVLDPARAVLALALTAALFPRWPALEPAAGVARLAGWILAEAALGAGIGVVTAMVIEVFLLAAQTLGFQAGYGYASAIDPSSEADTAILVVFAQLAAGMLFFAMGLDRDLVRLFARSLETNPPGAYLLTRHSAEAVIRLGQTMLACGLRLALPVVALLAMVDAALALAGRLNAQLQLLSLAFPVKMLTAVMVFASLLAWWPRLAREFTAHAWRAAEFLIGF